MSVPLRQPLTCCVMFNIRQWLIDIAVTGFLPSVRNTLGHIPSQCWKRWYMLSCIAVWNFHSILLPRMRACSKSEELCARLTPLCLTGVFLLRLWQLACDSIGLLDRTGDVFTLFSVHVRNQEIVLLYKIFHKFGMYTSFNTIWWTLLNTLDTF